MEVPHGARFMALAMGVFLVSSGCGRSGPDVVEVSGTITKSGKPVSHVLVHFRPDKGRSSSGRTDAEGYYELQFSRRIPRGAVPGQHRVYFAVQQERIDEPLNLSDPKFHPETREIVQACGSYESTPVKIEVTHEEPVIDIELDEFLNGNSDSP